jgi:hypothetical protein
VVLREKDHLSGSNLTITRIASAPTTPNMSYCVVLKHKIHQNSSDTKKVNYFLPKQKMLVFTLLALLAKVAMCEIQVSGNETNLPSADRSMRKGKTPMNESGEELLMDSKLQNLKLHDNLGNEIPHNIIAI